MLLLSNVQHIACMRTSIGHYDLSLKNQTTLEDQRAPAVQKKFFHSRMRCEFVTKRWQLINCCLEFMTAAILLMGHIYFRGPRGYTINL